MIAAAAGAAAGAGASVAAAAAARRAQMEEEEMTPYSAADMEGWEFKILRTAGKTFKDQRQFQTARKTKSIDHADYGFGNVFDGTLEVPSGVVQIITHIGACRVFQGLEVHTGTEGTTGACQHNHAHLIILARFFNCTVKFGK